MRLAAIKTKFLPLFLVLMIMGLGCSTAEKRYKVLSIFFDGVPDPNTRKEQEAEKKGALQQWGKTPEAAWVKMKSQHPDYSKNICSNCHDKSSPGFLKTRKDRICFVCHEENKFQGTYVHGPVASSDCLLCHLPHESKYNNLLKEDGKEMCLYCHLKEDVAQNPVHRIQNIAGSGKTGQLGYCSECHLPHAADNRFFLKKPGDQ